MSLAGVLAPAAPVGLRPPPSAFVPLVRCVDCVHSGSQANEQRNLPVADSLGRVSSGPGPTGGGPAEARQGLWARGTRRPRQDHARGATRGHASRLGLWFAGVLAALLVVSPAQAGSYLYRTALLLSGASRDSDALRARLVDRELARVVHVTADARVRAASTMAVPKEVVQAHPHLLLILESYERAADAATRGGTQTFLAYTRRAWQEEQVLRSVLKQLGWQLPSL